MLRATEAKTKETAARFVAQRRDKLMRKNIGRQAEASAASARQGQRLMSAGPETLSLKTQAAIRAAALGGWPVLEGERKYGFKVALAATSLDPACVKQVACSRCASRPELAQSCEQDAVAVEVRLRSAARGADGPDVAAFGITRQEVLRGFVPGADLREVRFVRESPSVLRILLRPAAEKQDEVLGERDLVGAYRLTVSLPCGMVGGAAAARPEQQQCSYESHGAYDFSAAASQYPPSVPAFAARVPLYLREAVEGGAVAEHQLPACELQLVLERRAAGSSFAAVSCELVVFLQPSPQWMASPWSLAPLGSARAGGSVFGAVADVSTPEELRQAQSVTRPTDLRGQVERLVASYGGRAVGDHSYRFVAYQGTLPLVSATDEHQEHHFRLGAATEAFTSIAVLRYVARHSPLEWARVSLHDPRVLEHFLRQSGATRLLEALQRVYALVGDGRLPTLSELLNHTSGLPEVLPDAGAPGQLLSGLLALDPLRPQMPEALSQEFASHQDEPERFEAALALAVERRVVPLSVPGARFHPSHLAYGLLRFVFHDWRSRDSLYGLRHVLEACRELGVSSATFDLAQARCALGVHRVATEPSLYSPALGLAARPEEVALALSDRNPWRGPLSASSAELASSLAFLSAVLEPRAVVERDADVYFSFGFYHVPLDLGEGARVRALVAAGCIDEAHVAVLCTVPAASLSFCFATTAPLACLSPANESSCSARAFVQDACETLLRGISRLENAKMIRVLVYSPELNVQLAAPPDSDLSLAAMQRHAQRLQYVFGSELENLREYLSDEYVPLMDELMRYARANGGAGVRAGESRRALALRRAVVDSKALEADDAAGVVLAQTKALSVSTGSMYLLEESAGAGADKARFVLAYDPASFADPARARACLTGQASQTRAGAYRCASLSDGLPGEYVSLLTYKLERPEPGCREREPVLVHRGRVYVRQALFEAVRRHVFASENEKATRISEQLADKTRKSGAIGAAAATAASSVQQQQPIAGQPNAIDVLQIQNRLRQERSQNAPTSSVVSRVAALAASSPAPPAAPPIERGGFGVGFGAGLLGGAALGVAATAPYAYGYPYPYAYAPYAPLPVYAPAVVGPYGYYRRRRHW